MKRNIEWYLHKLWHWYGVKNKLFEYESMDAQRHAETAWNLYWKPKFYNPIRKIVEQLLKTAPR